MLLRLVIDVLRKKVEFGETSGRIAIKSSGRATRLNVRVNRFLAAPFIFRCKVVKGD